ncbi:ABC transporter ATP-binding protein [Halioxenophilus sp. WMMB6]|uniref:ABC transporter ATP-binding protein n=1 Tax=Halioxenophilus sp. WMMB6 TaxID=3073815 RepID=UPI00295E9CD7|nr:ABC transporter ATP-binding protein [Halioxenophilus sp. WMMB6]
MFGFFERLVEPYPPEHLQQPPKTLLAFCRHYTKGMEKILVLMAFMTGCLAVGEAYLFAILGQLVDWLSASDREHFLSQQWPKLAAMSLYVLLIMPLVVFLHSAVVHQALMGNFPMAVRWRSHRYLMNQSYAFFQEDFSGRIATKVMQTALAVRESVMKMLDVLLFATVYMVTAVVLLANADLRISLPLVVWLVAYIFILRIFLPRLRQISSVQADARSTMTGRIVDSYTNILTLKLFSHAEREASYVRNGMDQFLHTVYPQMRLVTLLNLTVWAVNMLLVFSVGVLGIWLWLNDAISTGAIAIAMSLSIRLTGMSHWIMWEVSALFENIGTVEDGMSSLAKPQAVRDMNQALPLTVRQGEIAFNNVSFNYQALNAQGEASNRPVFEHLNVVIRPGEKVGIVGRSGAGKSTFVNLLLRFFDIQQGSITIDGQNIAEVSQESLRAQIGMVTQDTSLLHRSVRENIKFGRPEASEAEMIAAARKAEASEFIQELMDASGRTGFDAHVGERGVKLSGGQRQRVAIARVMLKDAPILVLDEATSALDSEVEVSIQASLARLMEGKTVIAIAHRLSTIAAMDRLLVFDKGRIVEEGSHEQLVSKNGLYAQLWRHQSGGFLTDF